jgi:hypothetical protein
MNKSFPSTPFKKILKVKYSGGHIIPCGAGSFIDRK